MKKTIEKEGESHSLTKEDLNKLINALFASLSLIRLSSSMAADLGTQSDDMMDVSNALDLVEDKLREALHLLDR